MKKNIFRIFSCFLIIVLFTGGINVFAENEEATERVLFSENFENGLTSWSIMRGKGFSASGGNMILSSLSETLQPSTIKSREINIENGELSFDFKADKGDYFGVLFRMADDSTYYSVRAYYSKNKISLYRRSCGGVLVELGSAIVGLEKGKSYTMHISAIGEEIKVFVDDNLYIERKDSNIIKGAVGFEVNEGLYFISNVKVYQTAGVNYNVERVTEEENKKPAKVIYVSPDGKDSNDGSAEKPLLTVGAAQEKARTLKKMSTPVNVIFKSGEYFVEKTIDFTKEDSGSDGAPVTYMAEDGAKVSFIGSKALDISKFTTITDNSVKSRLYDSVKDKVLQLDLKAQGISQNLLDFTRVYSDPSKVGYMAKPLGFYLNDRKQTVARWPNSGYAKIANATGGTSKSSNLENANNSATIFYTETTPSRWTKAENLFLEGYMVNNYTGEWAPVESINPNEQTIKLKYWTLMSPVKKNHRWAAINLLEEIDVPGEWYVDKDKMLLYYYPPYELVPGKDKFELAVTAQNLVNINGAKYINFKGIEFCKNAAHASVTSNYPATGGDGISIISSSNINIEDCIVRNIGLHGIYINKSKDININKNIIYETGLSGIIVYDGGDRQTLTHCNVVISNCLIADISTASGANQQCGVLVYGDNVCGVTMKNNMMYNIPNSAIRFKGNEHLIANNEIFKTNLVTADAGAIYTGRFWSEYGTIVEYNYIHDLGCKDEAYHKVGALYLDDMHSGTTYRNNIVFLNNKYDTTGLTMGGGRDNIMNGNTIIGGRYAVYLDQRTSTKIDTSSLDYYNIFQVPFTTPLFTSKYPGILENYNDIMTGDGFKHKNDISGNVFYDCTEARIDTEMIEQGKVENNITVDDISIFVDPENQDFRIKNEAKKRLDLPSGVLDESFDINTIGIVDKDFKIDNERLTFSKTFPTNNHIGVSASELTLSWEKSPLADEYEYIIATDAELENVVVKGNTNYTNTIISGLKNDQKYYWTVKAKVTARANNANVECSDGVTSFSTSLYDIVDKSQLESAIELLENLTASIVEGTVRDTYKAGTIEKCNALLSEANELYKKENCYTSEITDMVYRLTTFRNTINSYRNIGYSSVKISKGMETKSTTNKVEINNVYDGGADFKVLERANISFVDKVPITDVLCFKTKVEPGTFSAGYLAYALNQQNMNQHAYRDSCYSVIIKAKKFELQSAGKILQTAENAGHFNEDTEHEIQFAAIPTTVGANVVFKIDGVTIFDYIDDGNLMLTSGHFAMNIPQGKQVTVMVSDNVPDTLFTMSEQTKLFLEKGEVKVFDIKSSTFSESGSWKDSALKGYSDSPIRVTTAEGSMAKWVLTAKPSEKYKVFYWNTPNVANDKNVTVNMYNSIGKQTITLDLTAGENGFVELGEFEFTPDNNTGIFTVEFISSGQGELPVNCMKIEVTK